MVFFFSSAFFTYQFRFFLCEQGVPCGFSARILVPALTVAAGQEILVNFRRCRWAQQEGTRLDKRYKLQIEIEVYRKVDFSLLLADVDMLLDGHTMQYRCRCWRRKGRTVYGNPTW